MILNDAKKNKLGLSPSSLGDLFGVGFNTAIDRYRLDLGEIQEIIDDNSYWRMELGNVLENSVIDFFEKKLNITITNRNDELKTALNGLVRYRMDGKTVFNGVVTGVENKVSNASSGSFYDNEGYILQVQAYMEFEDLEQCFLMGLQNGEPKFRLIKRDREIGKLIIEMCEWYSQALLGLVDFVKDFPHNIVEAYVKTKPIKVKEEITSNEFNKAKRLISIKEQIKELQKEETELTEFFKSRLDDEEIVTDELKLTVSQQSRSGAFNIDALLLDYPTIDVDKYRKEATVFKTVRVSKVRQ